MKNENTYINSKTYPQLFADMDAAVKAVGYWAYPDSEWQHNFMDTWLALHPDAKPMPA